jgi:hypothetical protein
MDELAVAAIRHRLRSKITDLHGKPHSTLIRANPVEIANDEAQLGFALPPLMKQIYIEIGNGGFGPGYGLIGLTNGVPDDTGKTGPDIYKQFRETNRKNWKWPYGLLPICHWGCAILSCVDCADSNFQMRVFDPNVHEGDDWADSFFEQSVGFERWIRDWASGVDLWDLMYGKIGYTAQILASRQPVR